jgi:hypothetical protein
MKTVRIDEETHKLLGEIQQKLAQELGVKKITQDEALRIIISRWSSGKKEEDKNE